MRDAGFAQPVELVDAADGGAEAGELRLFQGPSGAASVVSPRARVNVAGLTPGPTPLWCHAEFYRQRERDVAKSNTVLIKLVSSADTGFFYVAKKNPRAKTEKLELKKFDPVARKHVVFKEQKIK